MPLPSYSLDSLSPTFGPDLIISYLVLTGKPGKTGMMAEKQQN